MSATFTPAQANRTLPLVKRIVRDILAKAREYRARTGKGGPEIEARRRLLEREVDGHIAELRRIGCEYKDWSFDMGLVDFPGRIDGKDVLLCWRSDEEAVTWYHLPEAGFAGRQPIPPELLRREA